MLAGAQAARADYDGFRIGAPPETPPPYSHLWAWTAAGSRASGSTASTPSPESWRYAASPATSRPSSRQEVQFHQVRSQTWPPAEKRVGPLGPEVAGRLAELYLVLGERPVTFVRIRQEPDG